MNRCFGRGVMVMAFVPAVWLLGMPGVAAADHRVADAAKVRDLAAVRALVKQGAPVNDAQPDGATALHWAAHWNDAAMVDLLLANRARVDVANDYGVTPLAVACADAGAAVVTRLLEAGADPNRALTSGETPLMTATRAGNREAVEPLLGRGARIDARETTHGQTALMWAISRGHREIATLLLDRGADARARSTAGFSPLLFAVRHGDRQFAEQLLARGADIKETAADGSSVLHVALLRGHVDLALWLLEKGADANANGPGYAPLHWAAGTWDSQTTHEYLAQPPQPHALDNEWKVLLGLPAEAKPTVIRALVARGADLNARTTRLPPRFGFSFHSFIRAGAGSVGMTPFAIAAQAGDVDVMRLLASLGADPKIGTQDKTSPLMIAAGLTVIEEEMSTPEPRRLEAVKLALELGNDINAVNDLGNTALHGTALIGFPLIADFLIKKGAALDVVNKTGETPLRMAEGTIINAMFFIHDTVAKVLKDAGAKSDGSGVCTSGIRKAASVTTTLCEDAPPPAGAGPEPK